MQTAVLKIKGMTCGGCVNSVKNVLQPIAGVNSVEVSLERGQATLTYDPALAGVAQFKEAIRDAGFETVE
jgi:copper chaperone